MPGPHESPPTPRRPGDDEVTLRFARPADSRQLTELAALDSASELEGEVLVALSAGRIVAAKPLAGGPAIADPFTRTAALVQMLDRRADQLRPDATARKAGTLERLRLLHQRIGVRVN